jgi:serine/threonine protein kinase
MGLSTGSVLQNRYRIAALLGQGGMGTVYRAWDTRLDKPVAIKELISLPGLDAATVDDVRAQFRREAVVLARLAHPNLVPVTDYFGESGNDYLVMAYVDGESLAHRIAREGGLPEGQVLAWAHQLLDALAYCHRHGVIHRDIKPQNVVITSEENAILVDFGLVKLWDSADPRTRTRLQGMGTPEYAPPEQWGVLGHHTDARSDLYSLGATLYHALTGQVPPTVTERTAYPRAFRAPQELAAGLTAQTDAAIQKAMTLAQDQRWASAEEMASALRSTPDPLPHLFAPADHAETDVLRRALPVSRRNRRILLGGATATVIVFALIAAALNVVVPRLRGWGRVPMSVDTPTETLLVEEPPATPVLTTRPVDLTSQPESYATEPTLRSELTAVPILVPEPTATPTSTSEPTATIQPILVHQTVALQPVANALWNEFADPPQGQVTFVGVPFALEPYIFKSQAAPSPLADYPTTAALNLQVPYPQRVHLLLTAGNAYTRFNGLIVGRVEVNCNGSVYMLTQLQVGRNLREWHREGDVVTIAPEVRTVWSGAIAGHPQLDGHIDILTLTLPEPCRAGTLTGLMLMDTSFEGAGSRDPAINFIALTVAHLQ